MRQDCIQLMLEDLFLIEMSFEVVNTSQDIAVHLFYTCNIKLHNFKTFINQTLYKDIV